jgi:SAM-dependent methyltransferase
MTEEARADANPYVGAYPVLKGRRQVWREIVRYVQARSPAVETLIELGPGYCDFVNQFQAGKKIAFDLNPEMLHYAESDVELRIEGCTTLPGVPCESVDMIFASNFLEHLAGEDVDELLERVAAVLKPGGRLVLIQPNYRLCAKNYFDDPTHLTIFDDSNIGEWLAKSGLRVVDLVAGLLPFSMNGRLPKSGILTRLYLMSPWKPLAAQMYIVAEKA